MHVVTLEKAARGAFWLCVLAILYLSLVPGTMRPHTGVSGHFEHFMAYAGTGFLFAPGSHKPQRVKAFLALAALSGGVEIAQIWIPGRTSEWEGFAWSSAGAALGLIVGALIWSRWTRRKPAA